MEKSFGEQAWEQGVFDKSDLVYSLLLIVTPADQINENVFEVGQTDLKLEVFSLRTLCKL